MTIKKSLQIALFLLPAFFILHSYNQCSGFIEFHQVITVAVLFYGPLVVCYMGMIRFGLSTEKTSLILLFISFITLFFGAIQKLISSIPIINGVSNFYALTLVCTVALLFFLSERF